MAELFPHPQARRNFIGLGVVAGMAMLAGCQVIPKDEGRVPPPPVREEEEETQPVQNLPQDENRNRVAVLVPMTGDNAAVGKSIANAANLALIDTGGEGVRITFYDTAKGAAAAANEALADGNGLFLGPLLAEDVSAVAPIARGRGVPVVAFSNDVDVAGNGVYIMGFNPAHSIARVVDHAKAQGMTRFAALVPDGTYGRRAGQAMIDAVEEAKGRLVSMQTFGRTPAAMTAAVAKLNAAGGYDAVLIADNGRIAMQAAPVIRRGAASAKILGTELWNIESGLGGQAALRGAWFASVSDARFNQLRTRYRARYGANPYRLASLGYDAVLVAIRLAGKEWKFGRTFPASALRDPGGFTGVDGAFRFGRDGIAQRALEVKQVAASGTTTVSPAPSGF